MNAELKAKWIEALRSGRYKQGRGFLRNANDEFCCLGVLCDIVDPSRWEKNGNKACAWDGLRMYPPDYLEPSMTRQYPHMNDVQKLSFNEIADFVEANE